MDHDESINEIFFTKGPVKYGTPLLRNMKFQEENYHVFVDILENILRSSSKSIHLLMYIFTSFRLADALVDQKKKGVEVLVVVDHSMENSSTYTIQKLRAAGITVKIRDAVTMHNKVLLIDVPYDEVEDKLIPSVSTPNRISAAVRIPKNGLLVTGSMNWTSEGMLNNEENFMVTSNKDVCEKSARAFFQIWNSPNSRAA